MFDPNCTLCPLHEHAYSVCLPGKGPIPADIMIIGEAPGANEDILGEPFIGASGNLLRRVLEENGIDPSKCYITNVVKCHPVNNATPKVTHIKACSRYLQAELEAVKPKYILALGNTALKATYGRTGITAKRGTPYEYAGAKVLPTYHPAAVLRNPANERPFRADIAYFKRIIDNSFNRPKGFSWTLVESVDDLTRMYLDAVRSEYITYDIETNMVDEREPDSRILTVAIGTERMNWVIPWEWPGYGKVWWRLVREYLKNVLEPQNPKKVAQFAGFDNRWLKSRGIHPHLTFDLFLGAYVLNVTLPHDLGYLAKTYLGVEDWKIDTKKLEKMPLVKVAEYNALDVFYTRLIYPLLKEDILNDPRLARVFGRILMPSQRLADRLYERGVMVNKEHLDKAIKDTESEVEVIRSKIRHMTGEDINPRSTSQVAKVLYDKFGAKHKVYTDKGNISINKTVLRRISREETGNAAELAQVLLDHSRAHKRLTAFLYPWRDLIERERRALRPPRLHTTYKVWGTATGRLAAENPNLQQVPRGSDLRSLIVAPCGYVIIEADYSQIELRIAAFDSRDPKMLRAYREGIDIHANTAATITGKRIDEVTKKERQDAKAVNFGFVYGMGWRKFIEYAYDEYGLVYTPEEAQNLRNAFFTEYAGLLLWHERRRTEARNLGYVRTPLGRIRHLPNIYSSDDDLRFGAERQAINTPVQSMASDCMLLALNYIDDVLTEKGIGETVATVHDSGLFEVKEDCVDEAVNLIKYAMEVEVPKRLRKWFGVHLDVPLVAEVKIGPSWGEAEEIA